MLRENVVQSLFFKINLNDDYKQYISTLDMSDWLLAYVTYIYIYIYMHHDISDYTCLGLLLYDQLISDYS